MHPIIFLSLASQLFQEPQAPPDFQVLCDHRGNYVLMRAKGRLPMWSDPISKAPFKNKREAIKRAWEQYNFERKPKEQRIWESELGTPAGYEQCLE